MIEHTFFFANFYCSHRWKVLYHTKNLDGKNHYHPRILTNIQKVESSRISFSLFFINTILNFGQECTLQRNCKPLFLSRSPLFVIVKSKGSKKLVVHSCLLIKVVDLLYIYIIFKIIDWNFLTNSKHRMIDVSKPRMWCP